MRTRFGVPVFYSTENLLKHIKERQSMEWSEDDRVMYERFWQNRDGKEVRIEDVTKILSPTEQTHLSDFKNDRYRVLEQDFYAPESRLQETFDELEDAEEYVEEEYGVNL